MIKLIIFDLDGVLVEARELHYEALNRALGVIGPEFVISRDEHLSTYDGLPTVKKLNMLTEKKGLPVEKHNTVWELKQEMTVRVIDETYQYDERMRSILRQLKEEGFQIAVATNSIRESTKFMLLRKGLLEYINFWYTNEDVKNPKPNTEMYLQCMIKAGVNPSETVIVEDSHVGRQAVHNSGAYLCAVKDTEDVNYDGIRAVINKANNKTQHVPKWQGGQMNVLIPMAGAGSRFADAGYTFPKPLIEVEGTPMIQLVVENVNIDARHIFIVRDDQYEKYHLKAMLNLIAPDCEIVQVDHLTEGAACTTLLAEKFIDNDEPLLIANSDQFVNWNSNEFMYAVATDGVDGGILTHPATHPKWSYAAVGEDGFVTEVAEKISISEHATVGIYYWAKGSDYVKYAKQMIEKDIRTNGEFYVCPVYNEAIQDGKKIKIYPVQKMWGLGTPEDLQTFLGRESDG